MQLVTLDDLKKLTYSNLQENQNEDFNLSFKDISKAYSHKRSELEKAARKQHISRDLIAAMSNWMKNDYLRDKCPPIALVGEGSSRIAYACFGGKCLKVAKDQAGVAQNKQEEKHTHKKHWWTTVYGCFVNTYDANNEFSLLLSECCAKISNSHQLADAFQMPDYDVFRAVIKTVGNDENIDMSSSAISLRTMAKDYRHKGKDFKQMNTYADIAEESAAWIDKFIKTSSSKMTPGQRSFSQLIRFWKKNGVDELLPGDVVGYENWGFAIRDGQIAPVLIDVGFSRDVAKKFYSHLN